MSDNVTAQLGDEKFVSLTTFKRDGNPVASPMWIVRDGPQLWLWTPANASKVKRVRRDPRVTLTPCGRTGKVRAGLLLSTRPLRCSPTSAKSRGSNRCSNESTAWNSGW